MHIKGFDPYDFSKKIINDVPVYYKNIPSAPCINVRIAFKTGAFSDPLGKEGLSHFLEHMIFDGSPLLQDKKAIQKWSKVNVLNSWHAFTNFANTVFWFKCLPEKFEEALRGARDMVFYPFIRPEDVEHERKVIIQEAWGRFKNIKFLNYIKEFKSIVSPNHDFGRFNSALGWPQTIESITAEDLKNWHKANFGVGNFFLVLTGAIDDTQLKQLEIFLKDLPVASPEKPKGGDLDKPSQLRNIKKSEDIGEMKEQVEISFFRIAPKVDYSKYNEVLNLTRVFLGDLLHEKLRIENSLCYSVSNIAIQDINYSLFEISVKTEEKNIEKVELEVAKCFEEIIEGRASDRFEIIKQTSLDQLKSQELISSEIATSVIGKIMISDGQIKTLGEQIEDLSKATYKEVIDFCREIYDKNYIFTEIILPSKK